MMIISTLLLLFATPGVIGAQSEEPTSPTPTQLVHRFDFQERDDGNLENIPMFWTRRFWDAPADAEFPNYADGWFDADIGHLAPPSFYLFLNGRNVRFRYEGKSTPVTPGSDYLVKGWIKPDRLESARATLSAYYIDRRGQPIEGSQRFSQNIGGVIGDDEWHQVQIHLPGGPPTASAIGITAWVTQAETWDRSRRVPFHIERRDIYAGAWFDDIDVYSRPVIQITTRAPGQIFIPPAQPHLIVTVGHTVGNDVRAELLVRDRDDQEVFQAEVPISGQGIIKPITFNLPSLEAGLYRATLTVYSSQEILMTQRLAFAVLSQSLRSDPMAVQKFGLVLEAGNQSETVDMLALIKGTWAGALKLPIWADRKDASQWSGPGFDEMIQKMLRDRIQVTGVFETPPLGLGGVTEQRSRTLLDVLSDEDSAWGIALNKDATPFANIFQSWQVGADGDLDLILDDRLAQTLDRFRAELEKILTRPLITAPGTVHLTPSPQRMPAEIISLTISEETPPESIGEYLDIYRSRGYMNMSTLVERLDHVGDQDRIARWVKQLVQTRHNGADSVFVRQPWETRQTTSGLVTEPKEEYIVFRTVADVLSDRMPGETLRITNGVTALAFHGVEDSVIVIWDDDAPAGGRVHQIQLGAATRVLDMYGRSTELTRNEAGQHLVHLTSHPIFIDHVDRWLIEFRGGVSLVPPTVEFSLKDHKHILHIRNSNDRSLAGEFRLMGPDHWTIRPSFFQFNLPPGRELTREVSIRYGANESAGNKDLIARVKFDYPHRYNMDIPLSFSLGLDKIDVWGFAFMEGNRLIIRHGVSNRSDVPISFRSFALVPTRSKQYRVINGLKPGDSVTHEYLFQGANALSGKTLRLGLREINGPRIHNLEIIAP